MDKSGGKNLCMGCLSNMKCEGVTEKQMQAGNGCGSSYWLAWLFRIPKWVSHDFYCACQCHDAGYQAHKTLLKKFMDDDLLFDNMYYSAFHSPGWQKWIKIKVADFVYWCLSTKLSDYCFLNA